MYDLFNSVHEGKEKSEVLSYCQNINANDINVTTTEMYEAVAELPKNKAPGYDGLMSEHFQFASPRWIYDNNDRSYFEKQKLAIWLPKITIDPLP